MLDASSPSKLCFRLLGEARLAVGDSGADGFRVSTQKGMALLVYLAMNAGRAISRPVLADLLWGDRVDAQARQNLRQCLLTLRRDLEPAMSGVLLADDHTIALRAEAIEVDALAFAAAANASDLAERQRCLTLIWGPFLENFQTGAEAFDEWVVAERTRLDALALRTFAELADRFDAAGDGERAVLAQERLVAIDPGEEDRHRRLLSLEARYRRADAALARQDARVRASALARRGARARHARAHRHHPAQRHDGAQGRGGGQLGCSVVRAQRGTACADPAANEPRDPAPASRHANALRPWIGRRSGARVAAAGAIAGLIVAGAAFALMHGRFAPTTATTIEQPSAQHPSWRCLAFA